MPQLPGSPATEWLSDDLRAEFEQMHESNMPHRADIKRVIYARSNGASVPSWPVLHADQPCRLRAIGGAQQRLGEQPSDASRYEVIFLQSSEARDIQQADRIDVVGRLSAEQTFAITLEVIGVPVVSNSGMLVRALSAPIRDPANV